MRVRVTRGLFLTFVAAAVVASGACGGFTQEERVAAPVLGPFTPPTRPTDAEIAWFHYDASVPLDAIERGREQLEGVERIDLTYASPHGGRVPAWVYEPDQTGPLAGIVVMHGMPGSRDTRWEMAAAYARSGAVVIAISAPFARPDGPRDRPITLTAQDRDEQVQLIVDLRRAVDYLQAHPQVDPERIGYVGVSYGGAMGGLLAGVEPRVKAYALMVGDGGLVAHLTGPDDNVEAQTPAAQWRAWLGAMEPIEPLRFVGLASSEVLFQNGLADELVPVADGLEYQQAGNELTTSWWYEGGHQMTYRRLRDQVEWLAPRLGIDPERFAL